MSPQLECYLNALHRRLRRDRARYATRFWHGVPYLPRDQGPAWDLFVR